MLWICGSEPNEIDYDLRGVLTDLTGAYKGDLR